MPDPYSPHPRCDAALWRCPRFRNVEVYSPRNVLHAFRIASPDEVDDEFEAWLAEAYAVGEQRHVGHAAVDQRDRQG